MHQIDPMDWEQATGFLVDYRDPLVKIEKKLSCGQPSEPKNKHDTWTWVVELVLENGYVKETPECGTAQLSHP